MYPYNRCVIRRSWWLSRKLGPREYPPPQMEDGATSAARKSAENHHEPVFGDQLEYTEGAQLVKGLWGSRLATLTMFFFTILFFKSRWVSLDLA
jgi:hypothetical protein